MAARQARNYMFTVNFGDAMVTQLLPDEFPEWFSYAVWQLECGAEGTMHYQGYLELAGKHSIAQVKTIPGFETCHLEVRAGSADQAETYCTKRDTRVDGPWHFGERKEPGKRSDLVHIKRMVDEGAPLTDVWDNHYGSMLRYHKAVKEYKRIKTPPRTELTRIFVIVGPSGVGKSRLAREMFPNAYWKNLTKWWDDYDGHADVVWDEFRGQYPFRELLRVLDSTPLLVETKGGHVQFVAHNICFTSNHMPEDWYDAFNIRVDWHTSPLRRRILEFGELIILGELPARDPALLGVSPNLRL